jgi:hypothetical protein
MRIVSLLFLIVISHATYAQNLSKSGVLRMNIRSSGAIIQDDQVKGYYLFYRVEKTDPKNYNYLLSVLDENLRSINEINIIRPKNFTLIEAAFNGEAFGFLFYDSKVKQVELISYDRSLKQLGSVRKVVSSKLMNTTFRGIASGMNANQSYLIPVEYKGFLYYGLKAGSKMHYQLELVDNTMKTVWQEKVPDGAKHSIEIAAEAFQSEDFIVSMVTKKSSTSSSNTYSDLLVHETGTGKMIFRAPLRTDKYSVLFSNVFYDSTKNNFLVFGEYFNLTDSELSDRSLGFITITYDMSGKMLNVKTNSWVDLSSAAPVNERGKFDGNKTNILFHEIVRTADGKTFVIGEQYKKAASAAGIVTTVLLGPRAGVSTVQLNVYNMVVFEFSPDYTINKVSVFEKDKNVLQLPYGYGMLSPRTLSYYAKTVGGFDYAFTQTSFDRNTFYVSYVNYDRESGQKAKNVLGMIIYTPEKNFVVDKLPMSRRSADFYIYKAKEGYVLITEYFRKEKKMESRLEKINY